MKIPPYGDRIATLLRTHFQTEESDAGLRSPSLEGNPKTSTSPDGAAVARASSGRQDKHRRCRAALAELSPDERNALSLAYGVLFRSRDIDDASGRRAPRTVDRNWRILLREAYRDLGDMVAIAMASPFAIRSAKRETGGEVVEWLLSESARPHRQRIQDESIALLISARRAFAAVYEPPTNEPRLDAPVERKRGRPRADDGVRFRLLGGRHGREIGR